MSYSRQGEPEFFYQLFEQRANDSSTRDKLAIRDGQSTISYHELNEHINQIANYLIDEAKTSITSIPKIGLYFRLSIDYIANLIAVMKAGFCFVPLSDYVKEDFLHKYAKGSKLDFILTHKELKDRPFLNSVNLKVIVIDELQSNIKKYSKANLQKQISLNQLAYIHNTSGSSGTPKQVFITHAGLLNCAVSLIEFLAVKDKDQVAAYSDISFDAHIADMMMALGSGASLCTIPSAIRFENDALAKCYKDYGITITTFPPILFKLLSASQFSSLRKIISTGDAIVEEAVRAWCKANPELTFFNGYGPSEVTIATSVAELKPGIPTHIGQAVKGLNLYVLEIYPLDLVNLNQPKRVKPNEPGELYISGPGVGQGYSNPELTKERFLEMTDPDNPSQKIRVYRTRDQASYEVLPNNTHRYFILGRLDRQVKISSKLFCSEHIETLLSETDKEYVKNAHVETIAVSKTENRFKAYLTINEGFDLYEYCAKALKKLPESSLPVEWHTSLSLIASPAGKSVPTLADQTNIIKQYAHSHSNEKPTSFIALQIQESWKTALHLNPEMQIFLDDDFFMYGGDSITVSTLFELLSNKFKEVTLTIIELYSYTTLGAMERLITRKINKDTQRPVLLRGQDNGSAIPLFLIHSLLGNASGQDYRNLGNNFNRPVYVINSRTFIDIENMDSNLNAIACDYINAIRLIRPRGPYLLGGWSAGGLIAYAMAHILKKQNKEEQIFLHIIDSEAFSNYQTKTRSQYADYLNKLYTDKLVKLMPLSERYDGLERLKSLPKTQQVHCFFKELRNEIEEVKDELTSDRKILITKHMALLATIKNTLLAILSYDTAKYNDNVILWVAEESKRIHGELLGWSDADINFKNIINLKGNHESILLNPDYALELSKLLEESCQSQVGKSAINMTPLPLISKKEPLFKHISNLPSVVKHFESRQASQDLRNKLNILKKQPGLTQVAITGIAGSGKSELARQYVLEEKENKDENIICWQFDAETEKKLLESFIAFLASLEVKWTKENKDSELDTMRRFLRQLSQVIKKNGYERFIWIFDNAKNYSVIENYMINDADLRGEVIVTSQDIQFFHEEYEDENKNFSISSGMEDSEALNLLTHFLTLSKRVNLNYSKDDAYHLITALDKLPLAISTAALYIYKQNCPKLGEPKKTGSYTFKDYLEDLKKADAIEKQQMSYRNQYDYKRTQAASLRLAIANTDLNYRKLLEYCIWLDTQALPVTLLRHLFKEYIQNKLSDDDIDDAFDELVTSEGNFSLLSIDKKTQLFYLHRSTQLQLHYLVKSSYSPTAWQAKKLQLLQQLVRSLTQSFPIERYTDNSELMEDYKTAAAHVERIAEEIYPFLLSAHAEIDFMIIMQFFHDYIHYCNYKAFYTTSVKWGDKIFALVEKIDMNTSSYFIQILNDTGLALTYLGKAQDSLKYHNKAEEIFQLNQSMSANKALTFNCQGLAYSRLGDSKQSLSFYQKALENKEELKGSSRTLIATSLSGVGDALTVLGYAKEALGYHTQAFALREEVHNKIHPNVALSFISIGEAYDDLGEYRESKVYFERALEMTKATLGDFHPSISSILNHIGSSYRKMGDVLNARTYHEDALKMSTQIYGDLHPDVAESFSRMGIFLGAIGEYDKSLNCYQQSWDKFTKIYGNNHPDIATSLNNLGVAYSNLGQANKAKKYYEQALEMRKKIFGDEHPAVSASLSAIGGAWSKLGNETKSLEYRQVALTMREKFYGESHPLVADSINAVGVSWSNLGDVKKSLEYDMRALTMRKKFYDGCHPDIALSLNNLGISTYKLGEVKNAEEFYQQALDMRKKIYGDEHPTVADSLSSLAGIWLALGKIKQSLKYYENALEMRKKFYGDCHPVVALSLNNLGAPYSHLGDAKKAKEYYAQALEMREKIYGKDHPDVAASLNSIGSAWSSLGNETKSLECRQAALTIREKFYGESHPLVADCINAIGVSWSKLGDLKKSLECYLRALAMRKKLYGDCHPDVALSLNNLGVSYKIMGELKKAKECYEQALKIRKKIYGDEHPDVASSLSSISVVWSNLCNEEESLFFEKKALVIYKKFYGDSHYKVADSLESIGCSVNNMDEASEARGYLEQSLRINENMYGNLHQSISSTLYYMSLNFSRLGDEKKAYDSAKNALDITNRFFKPSHRTVAQRLNGIGLRLSKFGFEKKALECYMQSLEIYINTYNDVHSNIATILNNIGVSWGKLGYTHKALNYIKQALIVRQEKYYDWHTDVAISLRSFGFYLSQQGEIEKALTYYKLAYDIYLAILGNSHSDFALILHEMGVVYLKLKDTQQSIIYHDEALRIRRKKLGDCHPYVADSLKGIADLLIELEKPEQAQDYYQQALNIYKVVYGEVHKDLASSYEGIGVALCKQKKPQQALEFFEQALRIYRAVYDEPHLCIATILKSISSTWQSLGSNEQANQYHKEAKEIELIVAKYDVDNHDVPDYVSLGSSLNSNDQKSDSLSTNLNSNSTSSTMAPQRFFSILSTSTAHSPATLNTESKDIQNPVDKTIDIPETSLVITQMLFTKLQKQNRAMLALSHIEVPDVAEEKNTQLSCAPMML